MSKLLRLLVCLCSVLCLNLFYLQSVRAEHLPQLEHFLILTDIHFDPFIACYHEKKCPLIKKLQKASVTDWDKLLTTYDTSQPKYKQDTNYRLLMSSLNAAKQTAVSQQAKFVLVLGDSLAHDYRDYYKKYTKDKSQAGYQLFVQKTFIFLANKLQQTFPTLDIYNIVGNNDSYQGDYETTVHGLFFKDMDSIWGNLIKTPANKIKMEKEFATAGYYSVTLPQQPSMRLIALNTNLFSTKAKGKQIELAANEQLNWLHEQLQEAKAQKQKVFIAMHIPEGVDVYATLRVKLFTLLELWQPIYTQRFQAELNEYATIISGIFTGHLHADWFQVLTFDHGVEVPVLGTPSISPIFGNNPGYKLYTYSPTTQELKDFKTYFYALSNRPVWGMEYDFARVYLANCHDCPIVQGMDLIRETGNLASYYKKYYAVESTSQPITTKWYPYYWCAVHTVDANRYKECVDNSIVH